MSQSDPRKPSGGEASDAALAQVAKLTARCERLEASAKERNVIVGRLVAGAVYALRKFGDEYESRLRQLNEAVEELAAYDIRAALTTDSAEGEAEEENTALRGDPRYIDRVYFAEGVKEGRAQMYNELTKYELPVKPPSEAAGCVACDTCGGYRVVGQSCAWCKDRMTALDDALRKLRRKLLDTPLSASALERSLTEASCLAIIDTALASGELSVNGDEVQRDKP